MKTTRENLLSAAKLAARVVEKKTTMPILSCVLLRSDSVTGCDMKRQVTAHMEPIDGLEPVAVPAAKLVQVLTALPKGADVTLKQDHGAVIVRSGRSRFKLNTMCAEDYPEYQRDDGQPINDAADVIQAMSDLRFAATRDDVRHYLCGLLLEHTQGKPVALVGTDGKRLAARKWEQQPGEASAIIPVSAVDDIVTMFGGVADAVIRMGRNIEVRTHGVTYSSNLIEGRYPDWRRIVPDVDAPYVVERDQLQAALAQAATIETNKYPAARVTLSNGAGKVESNNPEHDELVAEIDCETALDEVEVGFALAYLTDMVAAVETDRLALHIRSSADPMIVYDGLDTHLIAPMRL